jgi:hypothetical protein
VQIDPDKWDFCEMEAYRLLGDDERAAAHARSVIRISTGPDGTEISPMWLHAASALYVAISTIAELSVPSSYYVEYHNGRMHRFEL